MMNLLWLFALLLLCVALLVIWAPIFGFRRQQKSLGVSQQALNIQAFQSQVAELELERQAGRIASSEFEEIKTELERNLLSDVSDVARNPENTASSSNRLPVMMGVFLSVFVVSVGVAMYFELGRAGTLKTMEMRQQLATRLIKASPEQRIIILRETAEKNPDQPETWYALAQGYASNHNFIEAGKAYEKVLSLTNHPLVMAEYAQMLFFFHDNEVTGKVKALAERTIQLQPDNASALGLLGIDAFNNNRFDQAAGYWQRALDASPGSAGADALRAGIAQSRIRAQELASAKTADDKANDKKDVSIAVDVSLDEKLLARVKPETPVYVLAKALQGPPMPLAVTRLQVKDLPAKVVLNDAMAMMPQLTISSFKQVQLIARVSLNGTPTASTGDLQGIVSPVSVETGQTSIKILINNVVE